MNRRSRLTDENIGLELVAEVLKMAAKVYHHSSLLSILAYSYTGKRRKLLLDMVHSTLGADLAKVKLLSKKKLDNIAKQCI